jgi:hypothetical protein
VSEENEWCEGKKFPSRRTNDDARHAAVVVELLDLVHKALRLGDLLWRHEEEPKAALALGGELCFNALLMRLWCFAGDHLLRKNEANQNAANATDASPTAEMSIS